MSAHPWAETKDGFRLHLLATGHSHATILGYLYTLGLFEGWCEAQRTTASKANQSQVHRWVAGRLEDWTLTTNQRSISALRCFYHWLTATRQRRDDPTEGLKLRLVHAIPHRPYTLAELRALIGATENDPRRAQRDRAMLLTLIGSGVRVGELAAMRAEDIDWKGGMILVHGKGAKERWIAPGEAVMLVLRDYLNGHYGPVWDIKIAAIEAMIHRRAREASLGRIHPHGFRHTFAIMFLEESRDLDALRVILGHETLKQAGEYAAYTAQERALDQQQRLNLGNRI
jgi:integrase/recombinase XerC